MFRSDQQKGITPVGFLYHLFISLSLAILAAKIAPVYLNHYNATKSIARLASDPGFCQRSLRQIRADIFRDFDVSYIKDIRDQDITIEFVDGERVIVLDYQVEKPLWKGPTLVLKFHDRFSCAKRKASSDGTYND